MDLYLDDCLDSDELIAFLTSAGHRVVTPRSAGTLGVADDQHLEYAARHGLVLLNRNPDDFKELHDEWQAQRRAHPGILQVYRDNVKSKDMTSADIVRTIGNLIASGIPVPNEVHTLNHWR